GAVGTGFKTGISQTVESALGHLQLLAMLGQITEDFIGICINDRRADRDRQHQICTFMAGALLAATFLTVFGFVLRLEAVVDQGVEVFIGDQIHTAAITTVTTIRTTFGNKLLPAETHHAVTAFSCFYMDWRFINKLHGELPGITLIK